MLPHERCVTAIVGGVADGLMSSAVIGGLLISAKMASKRASIKHVSGEFDRECRRVRRYLRSNARSRSLLSRLQQTADKPRSTASGLTCS
jgi:hypothetical protein